jgi:VWFA-related protein
MRLIVSLILVAAAAQAPAPAQPPAAPRPSPQPPVTFKVEVNYVEIDASVTDAQGAFVRNLTKDDFQVIEDGKPQALTAFSMVDIPIERSDPPLFSKTAIPPDVATNRTPFEGRVFVLVIDDLHTRFTRSARSRAAARQFVERYVGANDIVAVVNTSGFGKGMQDFTGNRALALRAIDAAMGIKADSSTQAALADYQMNQGMRGMQSNANASFNEMQRYNNARNSLRTLRNIADYMAGMRGRRKAVVYFSEGINYDVTNAIGNRYAGDVQREIRDMVAAATRGNVNVYSVDPRGVTSGMEDAIEISGGFPPDNSIGPTGLMDEMRLEHDSLRVVAEETGGFAVLNQNDFRTGFQRILEDSSSYYVLGYYPTNDKRDGRFRRVEVKVLEPGLRVRARRGYAAPSPARKAETSETPARTSPELRDALDSPVAISGLTITAFAAPFKGAGKNAALALAIEVDGSAMQFTPTPAGTFANDLEVTMFAANADGKIRDGARDVINLGLRPQTHEIVRQSGFRIVRRLQVPPGKYQVRIGARESGGRIGTVLLDVDAPDFTKAGLTMSGIAIASAYASRMPTANPDSANEFKDVLPSAPTALREFPRGDQLSIFAEVYDNGARAPHRVEIKTEVLADDGRVVLAKSDERKSEELQGASGGYGHSTQVPLSQLAPGRYVLRITAKSFLADTPPVSREIEFRVR